MLIINPGSTHNHLDASDFIGPATAVGSISNNPAVLT